MPSTPPHPEPATTPEEPPSPAPAPGSEARGAPGSAPGATETPGAAPSSAPAAMSAIDCGQRLAQLWPALFAGAAKPIKLRIQKDIQERSPGVFSRAALSAFLHRHTGSTAYLRAIARGGDRLDLDGKPAGEISDEHRRAASDELDRRRASRLAREEVEAQQRRNRAGLLRDFERTTLTRANFCALKGVAEDDLDRLLAIARDEAAQASPPDRARPRRPDTHARHARQKPR